MFEDEDESPLYTNYCPYQQRKYSEYGTVSRKKLKTSGFNYISSIVL